MTKEQLIKIAKGAAIAAAGAILTYGTDIVLPSILTAYPMAAPILTAAWSIVVNAVQKKLFG